MSNFTQIQPLWSEILEHKNIVFGGGGASYFVMPSPIRLEIDTFKPPEAYPGSGQLVFPLAETAMLSDVSVTLVGGRNYELISRPLGR